VKVAVAVVAAVVVVVIALFPPLMLAGHTIGLPFNPISTATPGDDAAEAAAGCGRGGCGEQEVEVVGHTIARPFNPSSTGASTLRAAAPPPPPSPTVEGGSGVLLVEDGHTIARPFNPSSTGASTLRAAAAALPTVEGTGRFDAKAGEEEGKSDAILFVSATLAPPLPTEGAGAGALIRTGAGLFDAPAVTVPVAKSAAGNKPCVRSCCCSIRMYPSRRAISAAQNSFVVANTTFRSAIVAMVEKLQLNHSDTASASCSWKLVVDSAVVLLRQWWQAVKHSEPRTSVRWWCLWTYVLSVRWVVEKRECGLMNTYARLGTSRSRKQCGRSSKERCRYNPATSFQLIHPGS
jgi:hypothetical protein